jgi:hypothetical protein
MFKWFKKVDAVQSVIDWLGGDKVATDDISCYLCTMPDGERFITPDSDLAYVASTKGASVVGLPTVVSVGFITDNTWENVDVHKFD